MRTYKNLSSKNVPQQTLPSVTLDLNALFAKYKKKVSRDQSSASPMHMSPLFALESVHRHASSMFIAGCSALDDHSPNARRPSESNGRGRTVSNWSMAFVCETVE